MNLVLGKYQCWACELRGDGFDIMLEIEGLKAKEALAALEMKSEPGQREETWLV